MFIKEIRIETVNGLDVVIARTESGATVRHMNLASRTRGTTLCEINRDEPRETRFGKAYYVARVICGEVKDGGPRGSGKMVPNATGSMIAEICDEIDRVAGC